MAEVPDAGEDHGQTQTVGGGNDFGIFDGAAGLNESRGAVTAASSRPSGKGKNASEATTLPSERRAFSADFDGIDAAHLARADGDDLAGAGVDDGIRFHVLGDFPGELECLPFFGGGGAVGLDFGGTRVEAVAVFGLGEPAAGDGADDERFGRGQNLEEAEVFFRGEDGESVEGVIGRGDGFDEKFGDLLAVAASTWRLKPMTPPKAETGSHSRALAIAFGEGRLFGAAAGVGVFDDGGGGEIELVDELPGGVEIDQVVVGELFAVELFGAGDAVGELP